MDDRRRQQRHRVKHLWLTIVVAISMSHNLAIADSPTTTVPPSLEIEVLDPGVDPLGNPAVLLEPDPLHPGQLRVEIPPVVLVHR